MRNVRVKTVWLGSAPMTTTAIPKRVPNLRSVKTFHAYPIRNVQARYASKASAQISP